METSSDGGSAAFRHSAAGSRLTRRVKSFVGEVSVVGAKNLVDDSTHWTRKFVWSALLMASFCLAIYQVQQRIAFYRSYPVQTQINIVHAKQLPFPQVTICNENTVRKTPAKYYGQSTSDTSHSYAMELYRMTNERFWQSVILSPFEFLQFPICH